MQVLIVLFRVMTNATYRGENVLGDQVADLTGCEVARRRFGVGEGDDVVVGPSVTTGDGCVPAELLGARAEKRREGGGCELRLAARRLR